MTMQNPDKPILAKDLNDYHNKILPYLGGMPEVLANKFAKGDLYDTNEKMIGKWIDGKPLYQRVFNGTLTNVYQAIASNLGIDWICKIEGGFFGLTDGTYAPIGDNAGDTNYVRVYYDKSNDVLYAHVGSEHPSLSNYSVIIQYTKTTDQANSFNIGSDTDYSTEEKIVGTYIDGSYLYQKTINFGALPNSTSKELNHGIANIGKIIKYWGIALNDSNPTQSVILPYLDHSNSQYNLSLFVNNTIVRVGSNLTWSDFPNTYVTIQYTKSTS